ncbi:hypothetical protein DERP_003167 [Dermatophagoides pteronyssinus]|uniref:Uncharacterized protein n=1 Tax=Dermatophagoides pteronyssinus TaxID=6956 RepID=A0ABQ8JIQ4_DERPT|nr:hypothetical protein DERP_003167 [Dermatophagoides pteronyssinus]
MSNNYLVIQNDKRIDSINTNHGSGIDQNQIEYSFNEYYQYCLIELQRLEKDIDYSIMKKSNLMKSICIEQQQQQQSVYEHCNNHDQNQNKSSSQSKWPISSSSSLVDGQINSNQLHLFIWNLFNLYEKLSSFFHRFSNNTCPSTSSIINNNQLDTNNSSSLIMQVITVWYQIVEEIKDNLVEQQNLTTTTTTTANYFDPMIMIMNNNNNNLSITTATTTLEQKINELKQQQILFLKLLWQFTRHIRLIHWIQDF